MLLARSARLCGLHCVAQLLLLMDDVGQVDVGKQDVTQFAVMVAQRLCRSPDVAAPVFVFAAALPAGEQHLPEGTLRGAAPAPQLAS